MAVFARGDGSAMIGLVQRTLSASVSIGGERVAETGAGILVLVGFVREDQAEDLPRLIDKLLDYRIFTDENGRMNHSLRDIAGEVLLVPQFTLAADTGSGKRPGFSRAAPPQQARDLFKQLEAKFMKSWPKCAFGVFGADMQVALVNDGPVTFWLEV